MPKVPMDYSKCCIYKVEHVDNERLVYVGHTTCFNKRKSQHKSNCYNENVKDYNFKVYQMIREHGGWEKFIMLEVEKYPCNDKREAERREYEIMKELKASMNMINSYRTEEEITEYKKEKSKEYYEVHKEKIQVQKKEYYDANKPKIQEYRKANKAKIQEYKKEYRELNKEKIQEYRELNKSKMQVYREANREKINAKVKCECGCEVVRRNLKEHQSTKKHLNILKNMNAIIQ